jgi:hypothetical protein
MTNQRGVAVLIAWLALLIVAGGCTSVLNPLSEGSRGDIAAVKPIVDEVPDSCMSAQDRLLVRFAQTSPAYELISDSVLEGSPPLAWGPVEGKFVVIFPLKEGITQSVPGGQIIIYPYALLIGDSAASESLEVYRATPNVEEGTLLVDSLLRDERISVPLEPDATPRLSRALIAPSSSARISQVAPKYECDESLAYPITECWCTEWVHHPATFMQPEFDWCTAACSLLPPVEASVCLVICIGACIVAPYDECVATDCKTIYPCPW